MMGICTSMRIISISAPRMVQISTASCPLTAEIHSMPMLSSSTSIISRLISPSSATSTRRPHKERASVSGLASSFFWSPSSLHTAKGSSTRKTLPLPGSLSTEIRPPIRAVKRRHRESPSPVPPKRRVMDVSACEKGVKARESSSADIPMPSSLTTQARRTLSLFISSSSKAIRTVPRSENFSALPPRLSSI